MTNEEIIKNQKVVCPCTGVTYKTVIEAIDSGAKTLEDVNKETGTGSGGCKGARCASVIEEILGEKI